MTRGRLRDYEVAILSVLKDGEPHPRADLTQAGIRAIDPQRALQMYQQHHGGDTNAEFEGLSSDERLTLLAQHQVKGAKWKVSQAISHLEGNGNLEVASWIEKKGRKIRGDFQITEKGLASLSAGTANAVCEICGKPVDPDAPNVGKEVAGLVRNRIGSGGYNAIMKTEDLGVYYCAVCYRDLENRTPRV